MKYPQLTDNYDCGVFCDNFREIESRLTDLENGTTGGSSSGESSGSSGTGADGVGIESVVQTTTSTTDGGTNIIKVTLTDGTYSTFQVKNGSKGSAGSDGSDGVDGYSPVRGTDYWTSDDIASIESYCQNYINNEILGGAS